MYQSSKVTQERRAPPRLEECLGGNIAPEFYEEIVSYYRKVYYEALDGITNAITDHSKELGIILFVQLQKF